MRLTLHDWDKFTPVEWFAYVRRFAQGNDFTLMADEPGYHMAYHMHMRRNKHHWQWWVTQRDGGKQRILQMDELSVREFVADMRGQGRTVGHPDTADWFIKNVAAMQLHPATCHDVEALLHIVPMIEAAFSPFVADAFDKSGTVGWMEVTTIDDDGNAKTEIVPVAGKTDE